MGASPNTVQPAQPGLDPQIQKDLMAWMEAQAQLAQARQQLLALVAGLHNTGNVMVKIMEIMNMFQNIQGDQISGLSAEDNVGSDIRTEISSGQGAFNGAQGGNATTQQVQEFVDEVNKIQDFITYEKGQGNNGVMDSASLNNLQNAVDSLKGQFVDQNGKSVWGDVSTMKTWIDNWVKAGGNGYYDPNLKGVVDSFQTLNQSVSAFSATTNTELNFTTEQFKQFLGIDETTMQSLQKLTAAFVNNERSN